MVLRLLANWRGGLRFTEMAAELRLDKQVLQSTLLGLQRRRRVACEGRGVIAVWVPLPHKHDHLINQPRSLR